MLRIICSIIIFAVVATPVYAGGISSNWGEVKVENLQLGEKYDLNALAYSPFKITNNFDAEISLRLDVLEPKTDELKPGYLAVEDVSWITVKQEVKVKPHEQAVIPIQISIPKDKKYQGGKYQFWVWSRTMGKAVGVGLKSRIMISIKEAE